MNRKVLVTAGGSGIGKEIAKAFFNLGDKIFICDIDTKALQAVAEEMPGIVTTACNMADRSDIEKMVAFGAEALGGFDVLVNNAGVAGPTAPVEEINPEDWEKVMQVDLNGTFNVTRLVFPYLKKSPAGVIINMSSLAGRFGYEIRSPYATAKWGDYRIYQNTFY